MRRALVCLSLTFCVLAPGLQAAEVPESISAHELLFKISRLESYLIDYEAHLDSELTRVNAMQADITSEADRQKSLISEMKFAQQRFDSITVNPRKQELMKESNTAAYILKKLEMDHARQVEAGEEKSEDADLKLQVLEENIAKAKKDHEAAKAAYEAEPMIDPKKEMYYKKLEDLRKMHTESTEKIKDLQEQFQSKMDKMNEKVEIKKSLRDEFMAMLEEATIFGELPSEPKAA